jgi:hypothetical protein
MRCWAMRGRSGSVTIRLREPVIVDSVTLEHLPTFMMVNASAAPRIFRVEVCSVLSSSCTLQPSIAAHIPLL